MLTKPKSFLLVDDDPDYREFFLNALQNVVGDTKCLTTTNGEEALSTLLNNKFRPDYIFTDLKMSRMNGFEFIKVIRETAEFHDVPIIVYSSSFSNVEQQKVRRLGASACYSKNKLTTLNDVLKNMSERKIR